MHVAGFDKGNAAVLILSTDELKILWDVGITVDGVQYRIAVVYIIGDGPGLCKIMCTTGQSLWTIPGRSALYMQVTGDIFPQTVVAPKLDVSSKQTDADHLRPTEYTNSSLHQELRLKDKISL